MADRIRTWNDLVGPVLRRLQAQAPVLMLGDPDDGPFLRVQTGSRFLYARIDDGRHALDVEFDEGIRDHLHLRAQLPQLQQDVSDRARAWDIPAPDLRSLPSTIQVRFKEDLDLDTVGVVRAHLGTGEGLAAMYPSRGLTLSYGDAEGTISGARATPTMSDLGERWRGRYGGDDAAYSPLYSHLGAGELLAAVPAIVLPLAACYIADAGAAMWCSGASESDLSRIRGVAAALEAPLPEFRSGPGRVEINRPKL